MEPLTTFLTTTIAGNLIMGVLGNTASDQVKDFWDHLNLGNHDLQNAFTEAGASTFSALEVTLTPSGTLRGFLTSLARGDFITKTAGEKDLGKEFQDSVLEPFLTRKKFSAHDREAFLKAGRKACRFFRKNPDLLFSFADLVGGGPGKSPRQGTEKGMKNSGARESFALLEAILFSGQDLAEAPDLNAARTAASEALFARLRTAGGEEFQVPFRESGLSPELFFEFLREKDIFVNALVFHVELAIKNNQKVANILQEYRAQEGRKRQESEKIARRAEKNDLDSRLEKIQQAVSLSRQAGLDVSALERQMEPIRSQLVRVDEVLAKLDKWDRFHSDLQGTLQANNRFFGGIDDKLAEILKLIREHDRKLDEIVEVAGETREVARETLDETRKSREDLDRLAGDVRFLKSLIQSFREDVSLGDQQRRNLVAGIDQTSEFELHKIFDFAEDDSHELGKGAVGLVYRARHRGTGRPCALKILKPEFRKDKTVVTRFLREGSILQGLKHPNIVGVEEVGGGGGNLEFFIQMELVSGSSLRRLLDEKRLPRDWKSLSRLALQLCNGLERIHKQAIIHRDLNPNNIMITEDGVVKIMDFGVARIVGLGGLTQQGQVLGTSSYMSPEQARGESLDFRSDIFSLGLVLFEMFTFRPPELPPKTVRQYNPALPDWVDNLLGVCLASERERRLLTAERFRLALEGEGAPPDHISKYEEVFSIFLEDGRISPREQEKLNRMKSELSLPSSVTDSIESRIRALTLRERLSQADGAIAENRAAEAREALEIALRLSPDDASVKERMAKISPAIPSTHSPAQAPIPGGPGNVPAKPAPASAPVSHTWMKWSGIPFPEDWKTPVAALALPEQGRTVFLGGTDGIIRILDLSTMKETGTIAGSGFISSLATDAAGRILVAAYRSGQIRLLETSSSAEKGQLKGHSKPVNHVSITSDGRLAATTGEDLTIRIWDTGNSDELHCLQGFSQRVRCLTLAPDGRTLLAAGGDGVIKAWNILNGKETLTIKDNGGAVTALAVSPDGKTLYAAVSGAGILRRNLLGGEISGKITFSMTAEKMAVSPDGTCLAVSAGDRRIHLFDLGTLAEARQLIGHGGMIRGLTFAGDGNRLVSADQGLPGLPTLRIWGEAPESEEDDVVARTIGDCLQRGPRNQVAAATFEPVRLRNTRSLGEIRVPVTSVAWSSVKKCLFAACQDKTVRMLEVPSGRETGQFALPFIPRLVRVTPDGRNLLMTDQGGWSIHMLGIDSPEKKVDLVGHLDAVSALEPLGSGEMAVSVSADGAIRFWDLNTAKCLRTLRRGDRPIAGLGLSPDGRLFATGGPGLPITLWDTVAGRELVTWKSDPNSIGIRSLSFHPEGKVLATGGNDGLLRFWEVPSGNQIGKGVPCGGGIAGLKYADGGRHILVAGLDKSLRVFDASSGREVRRSVAHSGSLLDLVIDTGIVPLVSLGFFQPDWDAPLKIWEFADEPAESRETKELLSESVSSEGTQKPPSKKDPVQVSSKGPFPREFEGPTAPPGCMVVSAEGLLLASGSPNAEINVWDLEGKSRMAVKSGSPGRRVDSLAFLGGSEKLVSGHSDGAIHFWDIASGNEEKRLNGHFDAVSSLVLTKDGRILVSGSSDGTIRFWDLRSGHCFRVREVPGGWVRKVALSRDQAFLYVLGSDGVLRKWDFVSGEEAGRLQIQNSHFFSFCHSPTADLLALMNSYGGVGCVSGQSLDPVPMAGAKNTLPGTKWIRTPDGKETAVKTELQFLTGFAVGAVAISPDDRGVCAFAPDRSLRLIERASGEETARLKGFKSLGAAIAFSPDGNAVFASGPLLDGNGSVHGWGVAAGKP